MLTLDELMQLHPANPEQIEKHKRQMLQAMRTHQLRQLRMQAGMTQQQIADRIGVSQKQISKIETGSIENAKISTLRSYLEAIGGELSIDYVYGPTRIKIA